MTQDPFEYDVALSFASEDRESAEELARLLANRNIKVYLDEYQGAEPWGRDMVNHLVNLLARKARFCVLFISEHYPLKKWTGVERRSVQERAARATNEYTLLLRLDDTEVSGVTEAAGYHDLRQESMESIIPLLEEKITKAKRPSPPPQSHDLRSGNVPSTNKGHEFMNGE